MATDPPARKTRKKRVEHPLTPATTKLRPDEHAAVAAYAQEQGLTRAAAIRELVTAGLAAHERAGRRAASADRARGADEAA